MSLYDQANPLQAAFIGAGTLRDPLKGLPGQAMEADLDHRRRILHPKIGDLLREQRAIRKDGHQEAFLLRMGVDIQEIPPRQGFAAS